MRVKVRSKVIPTSFLKIEGRGTLVGVKNQRERKLEELVGVQKPSREALPRSKKGQEKREQSEGATARRAMEKSRYVRVIEGEDVKRDGAIEYFFNTGVGSSF